MWFLLVVALVACGHRFPSNGDDAGGDDTHDARDGRDAGDEHDANGDGHGGDARGDSTNGDASSGGDAGMTGACSNIAICAHALSSGTNGAALAVAVDAQRNVYVAGLSESDLVFGGHTLYQLGTRDAFVVSFTADGSYRWAKRFGGGTTLAGAYGIAVDAASNIYIAGGLYGSADFGGGTLAGAGELVASFDTDGNYRWARCDNGNSGAYGLAIAGTRVFAIGRFYTSMTFSPAIALTSAGDADVFVAAFDTATGAAAWARSLGGPYTDVEGGIAARGDTIAFTISSALVGTGEALIGWTTDGVDRWQTPLLPSIDLRGVSIGADGTIYVSGVHSGGIDVPPGAPSNNGDNEYVHAFDANGASRWSWTLPEDPAHHWSAIPLTPSTFDPAGHIQLAGTFDGTLYAGGAPFANGSETIFLASFTTAGAPVASRALDDHNATQAFEWVHGTAIDSAGRTYVVGEYFGEPNFGDGALPFASEGGVLIVAL